jgi:recombinational DNA repair ATPase RecF
VRIVELGLSGYKGVDVRLSWNRVNVLFGPNDAGKTNILEAIASVFGGPD